MKKNIFLNVQKLTVGSTQVVNRVMKGERDAWRVRNRNIMEREKAII